MAFSRAPPPTRGQRNLLGFVHMSSGRRYSLEQLMVESGRLQPEETLNHRAWGPLSVLSVSRKDVLAARIGDRYDPSQKAWLGERELGPTEALRSSPGIFDKTPRGTMIYL
eukprot:COSAG04_NODE_8274_length_997_cov_2.900891_2_plen_111_part_00